MSLLRKQIAIVATLCLVNLAAWSQRRTEEYTITLPEQRISNSLYSHCTFMDGRKDTSSLGIVQLGAFNAKARVVPATPLEQQFKNIFANLTDSTAKEGECLLLLRQLSFAEVTKSMSERGYCHLRASAFAKIEGGYQLINNIDTVVVIKAMDVTRAMFRNGNKTIHEFIGQSLLRSPANNTLYTQADIYAIDSVEKRSLPVYNTTTYTNGVYKTFEAFMQQQPEITNATFQRDKQTAELIVKVPNEKGKLDKLKSKNLYAVVENNQPYIATEFGYYPLLKKDDDLYFTGKATVAASQGDIIAAQLFFGILGGLLASGGTEAIFEMKIDHVSGGFIRIQEVK